MARGGKREGAGRKKGIPNKLTTTARQAFLATFEKLEGELEGWIRQTAEGVKAPVVRNGEVLIGKDDKPVTYVEGADPAKAADLLIRMAEYHFPKLGRSEVTGKDGGPLTLHIGIDLGAAK